MIQKNSNNSKKIQIKIVFLRGNWISVEYHKCMMRSTLHGREFSLCQRYSVWSNSGNLKVEEKQKGHSFLEICRKSSRALKLGTTLIFEHLKKLKFMPKVHTFC